MPVFMKNGLRILFVHVPKTGGTSVDELFRRSGYEISYHDPHIGERSLNAVRRCSPQHMHGSLLKQTFHLDRFDLVFMVVRHPMDRFRSELAMQSHDNLRASQAVVDRAANDALDAYSADPHAFDNHLLPQSDFDVEGCVVYRLEDGLDILRKDLMKRLDIRLTRRVPWERRRREIAGIGTDTIFFSHETQERIRSVYADDFQRYGYA